MESKETLGPCNDKRKIKRLLDQVKDDDRVFKERHLEVLNYIEEEDQDSDSEEKVYDAHGSRVMEVIDISEQLQVVEESASSPIVPAADPSLVCKLL